MNVSLNELRRREMPVGDRGGGWEVDLSLYVCVCVCLLLCTHAPLSVCVCVCESVHVHLLRFLQWLKEVFPPCSVEGYFLWVCRVTAVLSDVSFRSNQHHGQQHRSPPSQAPQQASISIDSKRLPVLSSFPFSFSADVKELDR